MGFGIAVGLLCSGYTFSRKTAFLFVFRWEGWEKHIKAQKQLEDFFLDSQTPKNHNKTSR